MGALSWLKKSPADPLISGLGETFKGIDSLFTSGEEKAEARKAVFQTFVESQSRNIVAEYEHGNALSRSWRPLLMLAFGGIIIWTFWLGPALGYAPIDVDETKLPPELWALLKIGIGGYIGGRSLEKITSIVAPGRKLRKMLKDMDKAERGS